MGGTGVFLPLFGASCWALCLVEIVHPHSLMCVPESKLYLQDETKSMIIDSMPIVTFLDICSSSRIMGDLHENGDIQRWRATLDTIHEHLLGHSVEVGFSIHKFLGDGWLLLSDIEMDRRGLVDYFAELCRFYHSYFEENVRDALTAVVDITGLTFGLDIGEIFSAQIAGIIEEFISPTLNRAARLQSSIRNPRSRDDSPANQLLMLRRHYVDYFQVELDGEYETQAARRTLRNIRNDDKFQCTRIWL